MPFCTRVQCLCAASLTFSDLLVSEVPKADTLGTWGISAAAYARQQELRDHSRHWLILRMNWLSDGCPKLRTSQVTPEEKRSLFFFFLFKSSSIERNLNWDEESERTRYSSPAESHQEPVHPSRPMSQEERGWTLTTRSCSVPWERKAPSGFQLWEGPLLLENSLILLVSTVGPAWHR